MEVTRTPNHPRPYTAGSFSIQTTDTQLQPESGGGPLSQDPHGPYLKGSGSCPDADWTAIRVSWQ